MNTTILATALSSTLVLTTGNVFAALSSSGAILTINAGYTIQTSIQPSVGDGSWFSMEVTPGSYTYTPIQGFNNLILSTAQPASSGSAGVPASPNIDNLWTFFGNYGVHQTTIPTNIISDDGAGNVKINFEGWDMSWNGIASTPLGSGTDNGIATVTCYTDIGSLTAGDCTIGNEHILEYHAIVPPGDASGFGGVNYMLHLEGIVTNNDIDADGISNTSDNCPSDANTNQLDSDSDGVGDICDAFPFYPIESVDSDGDGTGDNSDAFPNDPTETTDTDGDLVGDNADAFSSNNAASVDADNDGYPDAWNVSCDVTCQSGSGLTLDGFLDDTDNDGAVNGSDAFPNDPAETTDTDGDGIGNNADSDDDNDGVLDQFDDLSLNAAENTDTDGDGIGNIADPDDDNDGALDQNDAFPLDPTRSVAESSSGGGSISLLSLSLFCLLSFARRKA